MKNENVLIVRNQLKHFRNFAVVVDLFISVRNNSHITFWMCEYSIFAQRLQRFYKFILFGG